MNYNIPSQSGPQPPVDIHEPFTTAERIEQLSNIDNVNPCFVFFIYLSSHPS